MNVHWSHIDQLVNHLRGLKQVLLYAKCKGLVAPAAYKEMIIKTKGINYWNFLISKYGRYTIAELETMAWQLDNQIQFHLDEIYLSY